MHPFLLMLALAASPAPGDEARAVLIRGLDGIESSLKELEVFINTKFSADSDEPKTGMAVESPDDIDPDGLHAVIVHTVIKGSPADLAGIRPGDRILRIGARTLEHENGQLVRMLTDGTAGPQSIVLRRGSHELTVSVARAPIACLQRASSDIDQVRWHKRIADMRDIAATIRASVDDTTVPMPQRYTDAQRRISELYGVFNELGGLLSLELTQAMTKECRFKSAP